MMPCEGEHNQCKQNIVRLQQQSVEQHWRREEEEGWWKEETEDRKGIKRKLLLIFVFMEWAGAGWGG